MPKDKPKIDPPPTPAPVPEPDQALVLFGGVMNMLPKELEEMGLAGKVHAREIPGVPPNWKPVQIGDFLLGRVVAEREMEFPRIDPVTQTVITRKAKVLVFDTAVPGGFRSVWLGADLRIKMQNALGRVYSIYYDGETTPSKNSQSLHPMKSYRVFEVIPAEGMIPPEAKQITEG
jgi:hypothetical protein